MSGEKHSGSCRTLTRSGSPPHERGKDIVFVYLTPRIGITPAWAGKRRSMTARGRVRRDHPRMGGEKFIDIR